MAAPRPPEKLTIFMYQVGFGDCFLLKFEYPGRTRDRHVLIDFGTTRQPVAHMVEIADDVAEKCGGRLDAVVATHRHQDHISGFATDKKDGNGRSPGKIIASLEPALVVLPWTEDPDAARDARKPTRNLSFSLAHVSALLGMEAFAGVVRDYALAEIASRKSRGLRPTPTLAQLRFLGENNLSNKSAVKNLLTMGKKRAFVNYGSKPGLEKVLPGVAARVLGPPTLEQSEAIRRQRSRDEAEFWHLQALAGRRFHVGRESPFDESWLADDPPPHGRWLKSRLDRLRKPIRLQVAANSPKKVRVTLSRRETELASARLSLEANRPRQIELTPPESADGVLIATVWDAEGRPLAERLIFRRPVETLNVSIEPDQPRYVPGGKARLKLKTTDSKGRPVGGVVGVTVTDDSVLEMIEKREQAPRLPVMVFLESDVRELADAHVYLDDKNPQAPQALDLLLGTQGWRRFALVDPAKFIAGHGDAARRVLALKVPSREEWKHATRLRVRRFDDADRLPEQLAIPAAAPEEARDGKAGKDGEKAEPIAKRLPASGPPVKKPHAQAGGELQQKAQRELRQALGKARDREEGAKVVGENGGFGLGGLGDIDGRSMAFAYVRQYAHQARPDRNPGERVDFTETLYWHVGLRTDEKTGEATVSFDLSDAVTSFRVTADAFSASGALGAGTTTVESVEPFYAEPKLPLEVTSGDLVRLPLGLVNNTSQPLADALLRLEAQGIGTAKIGPFDLAAAERVRRIVDLEIGSFNGEAEIILGATAGPYRDQVTRRLLVKPLGFPIEIAAGGLIEADGEISRELVIPGHVVPGSLNAKVEVFPTPLANMTAALERLIVDPNGCFEQTSSTNYPLVMAQQYFQSHAGIDPALIQRANEKLDKGYDRLVSFECKDRGYEWFGQDPGHEALTAYGLMQFKDMAEIRSVDPAMLERTRKWVLAQRDGEGGFKRERRGLHTWVADKDVSNAYITWTLLSAGEKGLDQEVATVKRAAAETKNSYVVALAANVLALAGDDDGARKLRDRLVTLQASDGSINGATTSIVGSGGDALAIETTSLAALAWLSDPDQFGLADKAVRYLAESCKAGRFGSTQSTVLALKAIVAHAKVTAKPKAPGRLHLLVDGKPVGEPVAFDPKTQGALELPGIGSLMTPGRHTVTVWMEDGSRMPCAIAVNLYSTKPAGSDECKVDLAVGIKEQDLTEGGITEAQVTVTNRSDEPVPTPVAIIGLPGGLEVRHDQLKELVKSGRIAAYEVLGREVVLYWRSLAGNQEVKLPLSLVAALPGRYTGPASRAYLYYTDEHKRWVDPLEVTIAPRE